MKKQVGKTKKIKRIESLGGNKGPYRKDTTPLWDWGPHDIAMCLSLIKTMPTEIHAKRINDHKSNKRIGENIKINLCFENQLKVDILIGNNFKSKTREFNIETDLELIRFNPLMQDKLIFRNLQTRKDLAFKKTDKNLNKLPLNLLLENFSYSIAQGVSNLDDLNLGIKVTKVLSKIDECLR